MKDARRAQALGLKRLKRRRVARVKRLVREAEIRSKKNKVKRAKNAKKKIVGKATKVAKPAHTSWLKPWINRVLYGK